MSGLLNFAKQQEPVKGPAAFVPRTDSTGAPSIKLAPTSATGRGQAEREDTVQTMLMASTPLATRLRARKPPIRPSEKGELLVNYKVHVRAAEYDWLWEQARAHGVGLARWLPLIGLGKVLLPWQQLGRPAAAGEWKSVSVQLDDKQWGSLLSMASPWWRQIIATKRKVGWKVAREAETKPDVVHFCVEAALGWATASEAPAGVTLTVEEQSVVLLVCGYDQINHELDPRMRWEPILETVGEDLQQRLCDRGLSEEDVKLAGEMKAVLMEIRKRAFRFHDTTDLRSEFVELARLIGG